MVGQSRTRRKAWLSKKIRVQQKRIIYIYIYMVVSRCRGIGPPPARPSAARVG